MKKALAIGLALAAAAAPLTASASWWDVLMLKPAPKQAKATTTEAQAAGISGSRVAPTVAELQAQVAELERLLAEVTAKNQELTKKLASASAPAAKPAAAASLAAKSEPAGGLSASAIAAKARAALVLVTAATSSGSGVFVDSQGHVLVEAHSIWSQDPKGVVSGPGGEITLTLASGAKRQATLVGIDEANDVAILQSSDKSAPAYLRAAFDSGVSKGDAAYVASLPSPTGISTGGSGFVSGVVSQKSSASVEASFDAKPLDTGGALLNSSGELVGVPGRSSCKVLEEMTNCLKYTVAAKSLRATLPKLLAGMRLYKQVKDETPEEALVRGELEGIYQSVSESGLITYAINGVTGNNSFDNFNSRLGTDVDGRIRKLYVVKLKQVSQSIYQALDFLKGKADDLNIFLVNESGSIADMGDYQRKVLADIQSQNAAKLKEYKAQVDLWTKRKNEYDSYITKPDQASTDYLLDQGSLEEAMAPYLKAERDRILSSLSGETVKIF